MENEVHIHEHPSPIKTPGQLITVVVLAFVLPVALIVAIVQMITGGLRTGPGYPGMDENAIAARIKPVGEVNFVASGAPAAPPAASAPAAAAPAAAKPAAARSVDQIYQSACAMCHGAGLMGAPKLGDKGAWQPRIAQGTNVLHENAIKGIRAMPAKGGNSALPDAEVKAAVDFMVGKAR
jgi:cytochrome c5